MVFHFTRFEKQKKMTVRKFFGCLCDARCLDEKDACWNRSTGGRKTEKRGADLDKTEKTWILMLRHATTCDVAEPEECALGESCAAAKRVCAHLRVCKDSKCADPHCGRSRRLIERL